MRRNATIEAEPAPGHERAVADAVRQEIAAELHDCALQLVLAAHAGLEQTAADPEAVARTRETLDQAIGEMRRILRGAPAPSVAARGGLARTLTELCEQGAERAGLVATAHVDPRAVDGPYDDLIYVLAREFVENAVKHAAAGRLEVTVRAVSPGIELTVADDGVGMRWPPAAPDHHGLRLAEHRVRGAGGRMVIDLGRDRGTRLTIRLPDHRRRSPARSRAGAGRRPARTLPSGGGA